MYSTLVLLYMVCWAEETSETAKACMSVSCLV